MLGYRIGLTEDGERRVVEQHLSALVDGPVFRDVSLLSRASGGWLGGPRAGGAAGRRLDASRMTTRPRRRRPCRAARLDATGLTCATLTPAISATVRGLDFGAVLEIVTDDPQAEEGLRSWTRLTGNQLVAAETGPGSPWVQYPTSAAGCGHQQERNRLMATIIVNATHGPEDPERATLAFITGNVAATADQDAIVLLTIEGAWLGVRGRADVVGYPGMPALRDVMAQFVAAGDDLGVRGVHQAPGHHAGRSRGGSHHRDGRPSRGTPCIGRGFAYLLSLMVRTSGLVGREHETRECAPPRPPRGVVAAASSLSPVKRGSGRPASSSMRSRVGSRRCCAGRRGPPGPPRSSHSSGRSGPILAGRGSPPTPSWPPRRAAPPGMPSARCSASWPVARRQR